MNNLHYIIDQDGNKTAVIINIKQNKELWETISTIISEDSGKKKKSRKKTVKSRTSEIYSLKSVTKLSEKSFAEWDNPEDEIYNDL